MSDKLWRPNPRLDLAGTRTASARATAAVVATDQRKRMFVFGRQVARRSTAARYGAIEI